MSTLTSRACVVPEGATGTMEAENPLLLSVVEEFVSGLQDSKAKDAAKGKEAFFALCLTLQLDGSV